MLAIEKVSSLQGLEALKDEWEALLARCPYRTPFLTHDWMMIWWKYLGEGRDLCVLILRERGRMVAIAPLMRGRGRLFNRWPRVSVRLIETMANYHSNRIDFIFAEYKDAYLRCFWDYLLNRERWHVLRLASLPADSPTVSGLRRLAERERLHSRFTTIGRSPYLPISRGWERYCSSRSSDIKRKTRATQRLVENHTLSFELFTGGTRMDLVLSQLMDVSSRGWPARAGTAISSTAQLRGLYSDLARTAAARGWLFIGLLRAGDTLIAYDYGLLYDVTVYSLKCAFDPAFARLSPGHALTYLTLAEITRHHADIREYDFLGDADTYKLRWTQHTRPHVNALIYHPRDRYACVLHLLESKLVASVKKYGPKHP